MQKRQIYLKPTTAWMLCILLLAVALRFVLMKLGWPMANADESVIDLMARHIAYQGEHPVFFWGQNYMGTIQAYLGAVLIQFFGSSAFSVRLGTLFIFALYLVTLYFLVRSLYTARYALFITALLSIGTDRMISLPLMANGGYAETMFFGVLMFWLVVWLGLTAARQRAPVTWQRLLVYVGLGGVSGLALWSDQLILSAIVFALLFLGACCWKEFNLRILGAFLAGGLVGALPLILYNISAAPGQNSLSVLLGTVFSSSPRTIPFSEQVAHVLLISLPIVTGMPFSTGMHMVCGTVEPYTQPSGSLAGLFPDSNPWLCLGTRGGWSLGILLFWGIALAGALRALIRRRLVYQRMTVGADDQEMWRERVRLYGRVMLLGSGALWFLLFTFSQAAEYTPRGSCRYLICLLMATPAVLWPLWQNISRVRFGLKRGERAVGSRFFLSLLALLLIVGVYLVGLGDILANIQVNQNAYNTTNTLIQRLLEHNVTRVYSDYNTCSLLMFQSDERVICAVLNEQLHTGLNRYTPYLSLVKAAPSPSYLFPVNSASDQALTRYLVHNSHYQHVIFAGYSIYYPS